MSYIVPSGSTPPVAPSPTVSGDGHLYAYLNSEGVLLHFTGLTGVTVQTVMFVSGDTVIASGNPAVATSNSAFAYDNFPALGASALYVAYAYDYSNKLVYTTQPVVITLPQQTNTSQVWIKSTTDATLNYLAQAVEPIPTVDYASRQTTNNVLGNPVPVTNWDVWSAGSADWVFLTRTKEDRTALINVLQSGVVQVVPHNLLDIPSDFYLAGDISREYVGSNNNLAQQITVTMNPASDPGGNTPLVIPNNSWDALTATGQTWDQLNGVGKTWDQITIGT